MPSSPFAPSPPGGPVSYQAITPSDTALVGGYQFLRVGVAGNLAIKGVNDAAAVTLAVTAGEYVPFSAGYVMATNTTATGVVGIA
jgi:hypothetical protein